MFKNKKGFTLIELLIVITIIGILAAALLPSILGAPARARDAARKADVNNIVASIETFGSDHGHYPSDVEECVADVADPDDLNDAGVLAGYFQGGTVPEDPAQNKIDTTGCDYIYSVGDGNISYIVISSVEQGGSGNAEWSVVQPLLAGVAAGTQTDIDSLNAAIDPGNQDNDVFVAIK